MECCFGRRRCENGRTNQKHAIYSLECMHRVHVKMEEVPLSEFKRFIDPSIIGNIEHPWKEVGPKPKRPGPRKTNAVLHISYAHTACLSSSLFLRTEPAGNVALSLGCALLHLLVKLVDLLQRSSLGIACVCLSLDLCLMQLGLGFGNLWLGLSASTRDLGRCS